MFRSNVTARRPRARLVFAGLVFAVLAACGGDSNPATDTTIPEDDVAAADTDTPADTAEDTATADLGPVEDLYVEPKGFGERCRDNRECTSGYCVPSQDGNVCSRGCTPNCPDGWVCGRVLDAGVDAARVCLDLATTLCQPCLTDADCNQFIRGGEARCLDYGAEGSFCGMPCNENLPCSNGYRCVDESGAIAAEGQCKRDSLCECNGIGREFELFTVCSTENEINVCTGIRSCGADGLSACSAKPASAEICNGDDDDCNGRIDEDLPAGAECTNTNDFGTCAGRFFCTGGAERCVGQVPEAEICDGVDQNCNGETDEGFPDQDGDRIADCVDPDIDGDGSLNADDCAPTDPARSKFATESCNGVDDDCDGLVDEEGATGCTPWYRDVDRDTYGSRTAPPRCLCAADPATFYDATNALDCNDLNVEAYPGAAEVCNGRDDNCNDATDEGVQAPCGGCVNLCLLDSGPGTVRTFTLGAHASNVAIDSVGRLQLAAGQLVGTYRVAMAGWPTTGTHWEILFLDAETPGNGVTTLKARWRTAATAPGLTSAAWSAWSATVPPANSPFWMEVNGRHFEVELELRSTNIAQTPLIRGLTVLSSSTNP